MQIRNRKSSLEQKLLELETRFSKFAKADLKYFYCCILLTIPLTYTYLKIINKKPIPLTYNHKQKGYTQNSKK